MRKTKKTVSVELDEKMQWHLVLRRAYDSLKHG